MTIRAGEIHDIDSTRNKKIEQQTDLLKRQKRSESIQRARGARNRSLKKNNGVEDCSVRDQSSTPKESRG